MIIKLLTIVALIISPAAYAVEINSPPPVSLLLLPFAKTTNNQPLLGGHGHKEYCFYVFDVNYTYTVYSKNLLGEGYSFFKDKPNQTCVDSKNRINTTNKLGIYIGISKDEASKLLGVQLTEGANTIKWIYQRPIHNLPYDDMTTLDITIKNGLVYAFILFNTVTS